MSWVSCKPVIADLVPNVVSDATINGFIVNIPNFLSREREGSFITFYLT